MNDYYKKTSNYLSEASAEKDDSIHSLKTLYKMFIWLPFVLLTIELIVVDALCILGILYYLPDTINVTINDVKEIKRKIRKIRKK